MAPSRKKTKGWLRKERVTAPRYSHRQHRKRPNHRARTYLPISVPELVLRLLNVDEHNQDSRGDKVFKNKDSSHERMRKQENLSEPLYDTVSLRESTTSIDDSEYTKSEATSMDNLSRVMEATNSAGVTGSENSSVSNVSVKPIMLAKSIDNTRALLKKKSLVQIINNYIKAGIEEGKRQAKKYIRKALSFGVRSGYLIPADRQGQVIRVSPTLVESRRGDPESRRKRRRARRGEEEDPYVDRKEQRREILQTTTKRKSCRETSPERLAPQKRKKISRNSRMNLPVTNNRKDLKEQIRQEGNKRNTMTTKKKGKAMYYVPGSSQKSIANTKRSKREEERRRSRTNTRDKAVERKQNNRNQRTTSLILQNDGYDNATKDHRSFSDEDRDSTKSNDDEVNRKTVTERRKSASTNREMVQQKNDEAPGNPAIEIEEILEFPNLDEANDSNSIKITN